MTPDRQFPLSWPFGWKRTKTPGRSQFKTEPGRSTTFLMEEIRRLGGASVVISSNAAYRNDGMPYARQPNISDAGVAVYFKRRGKDMVFACDSYWTIHENIHAIGKTIEALRAIERYGASDMMERAFTGFTALPAPIVMGAKRPWWEVLGLPSGAHPDQVRAAYRELAAVHHPDRGGSAGRMAEINAARDEAFKEVGHG